MYNENFVPTSADGLINVRCDDLAMTKFMIMVWHPWALSVTPQDAAARTLRNTGLCYGKRASVMGRSISLCYIMFAML